MQKFNEGDVAVLIKDLALITNPYHFKNATIRSFITVASANERYFALRSDIDLTDYFSRENGGSSVVSQNSQIDQHNFRGKLLHAVHDKDEILTRVNKICDDELQITEEKTAKEMSNIQGQINRLQEKLADLEKNGIQTCDRQHHMKSFIENNRNTFIETLNKS